VVDASGWRAVLARRVAQRLADRLPLSFGLETEVPYNADAFYFWLDQNLVKDGVGWIFPAGRKSRVGLASYRGETMKAERVRRFLRPTGAAATSFHGGFFPSRLRTATAGEVFLVGDSAGHCLPLTGEGIRPAIYFGQRCGDLIQRAMEGAITVTEALATYRQIVNRYRWLYRSLRLAQWWLPGLPAPLMRWLLRFAEMPAVHRPLLRAYMRTMALELPLRSSGPARTRAPALSQRSGASQFGFSGGAHHVSDGPDR
jgi:flavin-dependent dehydrogenase